MKSNNLLRSAIAFAGISVALFLTPARAQEKPKLSDAEVA